MTNTPNIIWLTLDSVRYDHTTMSGYDRKTTPNIQELSEDHDGVSFSSCFSHARSSHASVPSILSGTYPSRHRTYFGNRNGFPDGSPLVAELLQNVGYNTVGISNNGFASSLTNLDRGFDDFTLLRPTPTKLIQSAGIKNTLKYLLNIRKHSVGFSIDSHAHSAGYLLKEITEERLRTAEPPFFFYVHFNEPHRAYYPPLPYLDLFTEDISMEPTEAANFSMQVHHNLLDIVANGCNLTQDEWDALIAMYDSEIAYTDSLLGELFQIIEETLGETIIVVTADHGELFGEDDMLAHKYSMHNAVLNVPMVIKGIEGLSDNGVIQHTDVIRTLLEIAGADTDTIQGIDLRSDTRQYAVSQSGTSDIEPLIEKNPEFDRTKFCTAEYSVVQNTEYKYIQRPNKPKFYQLPNEEINVIEEFEEQANKMDTWLSEWLNTEGDSLVPGREVELNDEMRSRLADLGYLDHEM